MVVPTGLWFGGEKPRRALRVLGGVGLILLAGGDGEDDRFGLWIGL